MGMHRTLGFSSWALLMVVGLWTMCVLVMYAIAEGTDSSHSHSHSHSHSPPRHRSHRDRAASWKLPMEFKEIAPGVYMPVVSIGCGGTEKSKTFEIVSNWLSLGGTGIDTALGYKTQEGIVVAIDEYNTSTTHKGTLKREDLFLTTKIPDCNASRVAQNIEASLLKLKTSYVDLMLIHAPRRGDCVEAWKILENYYHQNTTRSIGVSNFRRGDLEPLVENGSIVPHVNQIKLNIADKDLETLRYASRHGITIEAYSPLGRGGGEVVGLPLVQEIAASHNVTAYQIAIQWILQHGWILAFQSSSIRHQASNADVFGWHLTPDEMDQLDRIGDPGSGQREHTHTHPIQ